MDELNITIIIEEFLEALGGREESERTFNCEFEYEPADRSVGIMNERFTLIRVVDQTTGEEYHEDDFPTPLWATLEDELITEAKNHREEAKAERQIEAMEWNRNFPFN